MPEESSNSARTFFANRERVLQEVRNYAEAIKRRPDLQVLKIGLFGSYSKDTYGPASDVDLLIVLESNAQRFMDRIPDLLPENLSVACDVFPYTKDELERMQRENSPWIRHVLEEVIWLEG